MGGRERCVQWEFSRVAHLSAHVSGGWGGDADVQSIRINTE